MVVYDIHLEFANKESFRGNDNLRIARFLLEHDTPVVISAAPCMEHYWETETPEILQHIRGILSIKGNVLGQQGNLHKCRYPHKIADPYHENYCLSPWNNRLTAREQEELMKRGRDRLERIFRMTPYLYVPPNHYHDEATIEVAEKMGYKFFADLQASNCSSFTPFKIGGMTFFAEGNLEKGVTNAPVQYVHYDRIDSRCPDFLQLIGNASPLESLKCGDTPFLKVLLNDSLKYAHKLARDARNLARAPFQKPAEDNLKRE